MILQIDYAHTLDEFIKQHGMEPAARRLGVTRAAVRQMLTSNRNILVKKIGRRWCYAEVKEYKHARARVRSRAKHMASVAPVTEHNTQEESTHAKAA